MFTATPARKTRGAKHVPAVGSEPLEGHTPRQRAADEHASP